MKQLPVILLFCLIFTCTTFSSISSQSPQTASTKTEDLNIKVGVELVVVDAQVMQFKTGRVVGDLKKEDFLLFEDGVKQEITHFSQDSLPLSVILLVDRAGCLDPFSSEVQRATLQALNRLKPDDEVALMTFDEKVELVKGFRFDRKVIADAIDYLPEHDEDAGHCFNLAFYEAAKYMNKAGNPAGRRVIIVITGRTKGIDCPGPSSEEARMALLESGSVVCGLIPSSTEQRFENGILNAGAAMAGMFKSTLNLEQVAAETGGEVVSAKARNLEPAFNNLINNLRTRYSLGFTSSNNKQDGGFRKLKLQLEPSVEQRKGKLVLRTRRGYMASKAKATTP